MSSKWTVVNVIIGFRLNLFLLILSFGIKTNSALPPNEVNLTIRLQRDHGKVMIFQLTYKLKTNLQPNSWSRRKLCS